MFGKREDFPTSVFIVISSHLHSLHVRAALPKWREQWVRGDVAWVFKGLRRMHEDMQGNVSGLRAPCIHVRGMSSRLCIDIDCEFATCCLLSWGDSMSRRGRNMCSWGVMREHGQGGPHMTPFRKP